MATSVDKSHSTMWARFQSESTNRVVKLLRKSRSMDTLLETTNWIPKDIPDYDTVTALHPTSLPTVPLTKWEVLLHQHGEDHFLHLSRNFTTSKSCPSLVCRPESSTAFTVHGVTESHCEEIPSIAYGPEDVSIEETNQLALELDALTLESVQCNDDNKMPDQTDEFFSWALERAEKSNIKDKGFEELVEEKEGLILENDYLSPTVTVGKLVNQGTNAGPEVVAETLAGRKVFHSEYFDTNKEPEYKERVPGVNIKCDIVQVNQTYEKMEVAAKPEHLGQIGSTESFEYSFTKSKRKSYCAEEEMKLVVKDKAEIDCKNRQTKFTLEHYQGLDMDLAYSEELFDEIDDDDDSANLETRTMLCLPFLCWRRRNKHEKEQKTPNFFER